MGINSQERLEEEGTVNISNFRKTQVVKALYDAAKPAPHYDPMSEDDIQEYFDKYENKYGRLPFIDYLNGVDMKIDISTNSLDTRSYNQTHGPRAAEQVIENLT